MFFIYIFLFYIFKKDVGKNVLGFGISLEKAVFLGRDIHSLAVVGSQEEVAVVSGSPSQVLDGRMLVEESSPNRSNFPVGAEYDKVCVAFCVHGSCLHCFYCSNMLRYKTIKSS